MKTRQEDIDDVVKYLSGKYQIYTNGGPELRFLGFENEKGNSIFDRMEGELYCVYFRGNRHIIHNMNEWKEYVKKYLPFNNDKIPF